MTAVPRLPRLSDVSNVQTSSDKRSRYTNFERGRIYLRDGTVTEIHGAIFVKHEPMHGVSTASSAIPRAT